MGSRMTDSQPSERLTSLDQFRGYTVVGMLLVNFLGSYDACPTVLRHSHDYVSYADTIMPQFLFAVGFAMRLTIARKARALGAMAVRSRMVMRLLGLVLISLVIYTVGPPAGSWQELVDMGWWGAIREPLKRGWFQTLMHIACTSLWILPVVQAGAGVRLMWLAASAMLHVWLSDWFNFEWVNTSPNGIDGGPLGFLTWAIPALIGTLACDLFTSPRDRTNLLSGRVAGSIALAIALMCVGYVLSCGTRFYDVNPDVTSSAQATKLARSPVWPTAEQIEEKADSSSGIGSYLAEPPFVPPPGVEQRKWNYWMMSQRAGTLSYVVFAAGFSLAVFVLFYGLCDVWGFQWRFFRLFGTNALLAYILHDLVASAVKPFAPRDAPDWYVASALLVFFGITWIFVRHFEKSGIYVRV